MSALLVGAALGLLISWGFTGTVRQDPINRKPPAPQPRTPEEARRWRAGWEAKR